LSPLDYSEGAILVFSRIEGQFEKVLELEGSKLINPYQFLESLHPQPGLELSQALIEKAIQQQKTLVVLFTSPSELSSVASFQRIAFKNLVRDR
jgi:hypothetical protein